MENLWNTNNLENLVEINSGICLNQFCCRKGRSASCLASLSLPVHQGSGLLSSLSSPPPVPSLPFFLPSPLSHFFPPSQHPGLAWIFLPKPPECWACSVSDLTSFTIMCSLSRSVPSSLDKIRKESSCFSRKHISVTGLHGIPMPCIFIWK